MAKRSPRHQEIIDRANRLLKQSKILRKMSNELLQESHDIRTSVNELTRDHSKRAGTKKR